MEGESRYEKIWRQDFYRFNDEDPALLILSLGADARCPSLRDLPVARRLPARTKSENRFLPRFLTFANYKSLVEEAPLCMPCHLIGNTSKPCFSFYLHPPHQVQVAQHFKCCKRNALPLSSTGLKTKSHLTFAPTSSEFNGKN